MAAARIPATELSPVLTDADWVQDFEFTDDGVAHDFGDSTFSLAAVPVGAASGGFQLTTAAATLELQGARVCVRVPAAQMAGRTVGKHVWELREHRPDGGIVALAYGELTINAGLSGSIDGDPLQRATPVTGTGGTITVNTPPAGPLQVSRGVGGPVGRSALQHLIANGSLPVGATEADFEDWMRQQAQDAIARFTQAVSVGATTWTVNHNLGSKPHVTVLNAAGEAVIAAVRHVTDNQVQISFDTPQTGFVRCA